MEALVIAQRWPGHLVAERYQYKAYFGGAVSFIIRKQIVMALGFATVLAESASHAQSTASPRQLKKSSWKIL